MSIHKLKIVHINTHDIAGGAAKVAWRLVEAQRGTGYDARMLVGNKMCNSENSSSFDSLQDFSRQEDGLLYYELQGSHNLVFNPLIRDADVIHLHNLHGNYFNYFSIPLLSRIKPIVWTLHDMQAFTGHCAHSFECQQWATGCGNCPRLDIEPAIYVDRTEEMLAHKRAIYEHSTLSIVCPSGWLYDKVRQSVLSGQQIDYISNGIDTPVFKPYPKASARQRFNLPGDAILIGATAHGGTLTNQWKGGDTTLSVLCEILPRHSNVYFVNIGSDEPSDNARIINIPHLHDEASLSEAYSCLDFMLYTPVADNCPLVVLEALSCGVPLVTTQTGGVPELVQDGVEGYVVPDRSIHDLVNCVHQLIIDEQLRTFFSVNARKRAINFFDHASIAKKYEELYGSAIQHWHSTRSRRAPFDELAIFPPRQILSHHYLGAVQEVKSLMATMTKLAFAKQTEATILAEEVIAVNEKSIVEQYWSVNDCSASDKNFYCFPAIRNRSCQLIFDETDSSSRDWCEFWTVEKYLKQIIPVNKLLSICCGFGEVERTLSRLGVARNIVGIDIAPGAIEKAKERALKEGLFNIEYRVSDMNQEDLPADEYDIIWANGALHHVKELETVIPMLYSALKDGGFLISNEYVGPRYQQVNKKQQDYINQARQLLPPELKKSDEPWLPYSVEYFLKTDPSECVRSDQIIATLKNCFEKVEVKNFGGSILFYALDEAFYENFNPQNSSHVKVLECLFAMEGLLIASGEIQSDNAHIISQKAVDINITSNLLANRSRSNIDKPSGGDNLMQDTSCETKSGCDVSLVVATKNRAPLLDKMLTSLRQSAQGISIEIIAIDGGSNDETVAVLNAHQVDLILDERTELGEGRHSWPQLYNLGFSRARGKWAMYASDDIVFEGDCLASAVALLKHPSESVAGGIFYYKNVFAETGWDKFGIDYTYGHHFLLNYGLFRLDRFFDVCGLSEDYKFYCADGDLCFKFYSRNWQLLPLSGCFVTHNNVLDVQKIVNLEASNDDIALYRHRWRHLMTTEMPTPRRLEYVDPVFSDFISQCLIKRIWRPGEPLRIHLGCGEQYLEGYINIDFPATEHQIQTITAAEIFSDITELVFPPDSLDEIRLHHVFEHFNRVTALGLLVRWHDWLKPGGRLMIETPDIEGSSKILLSDLPWQIKAATIRHLAGDQADSWAYHVDHWLPERFQRTLSALGFTNIQTTSSNWPHEPYLANVTVVATKHSTMARADLLTAADSILQESTVNSSEKRMYSVWQEQLRDFLSYNNVPTVNQKDETIYYGRNNHRQQNLLIEKPGIHGAPTDRFKEIMNVKRAHFESLNK